jgi:alanyl-tRNA synthetase
VKVAAQTLGGGGGGKDDLAQGGGQDPSRTAEALRRVEDELRP